MDKKNQDTYIMPTRCSLQISRHIQTESEVMDKGFYANENEKKPGIATLIRQNTL